MRVLVFLCRRFFLAFFIFELAFPQLEVILNTMLIFVKESELEYAYRRYAYKKRVYLILAEIAQDHEMKNLETKRSVVL